MSNRAGLILIAAVVGSSSLAVAADPDSKPLPGRAFAASRRSIDESLARPYDREVPFGGVGDRVWASSPQGWAFRDDVHWLALTNLMAFDLEVRDERGRLVPDRATHYPSHVHFEGTRRGGMTASASFTFALDKVENPLTEPFDPAKRWTCWSSGKRQDWYEVDFGAPTEVSGFDLYFFDDAPHGECRPPASVRIGYFNEERSFSYIRPVEHWPNGPRAGKNEARFRPVLSSRFRIYLHHAGERFYTGIYGVKPIYERGGESPSSPLRFTADKFINADDILVAVVRVQNPTDRVQSLFVTPIIGPGYTFGFEAIGSVSGLRVVDGEDVESREPRALTLRGHRDLHGRPVDFRFRYAVVDDPLRTMKVAFQLSSQRTGFGGFEETKAGDLRGVIKVQGHPIPPGRTKVFKAALELRPSEEKSHLDGVLRTSTRHNWIIRPQDQDARDPVAMQAAAYQGWFDANLPYFDCSDPWIRKMYDHRAYLLRKSTLDPKLDRMQWPTQSEGRWRSPWYSNVISYGAGHQIREARWLRDPKYWEGHLRTWAENAKPDGVYPRVVTPEGPGDGQYADWITSTAWDGHLVHPDRAFLASMVEKLAANVRGWQATCDADGDGLLRVDSHWWTGMEYQPSFFAFSGYKTSKDFYQPATKVDIERVDLTAYQYGNAVAVGRIYRLLGEPGKAREFEDLAGKIASAVLAKMWRPEKRFFYSLRAGDDAVADVKEVIGVYPFYFGMPPTGKGYEAAWASILDPKQFWTPWPVASASKECPAYSQSNWPGDGRSMPCMWNGPTWPHANALVMSAMARTIRGARDGPLKKEHLWALFLSFTKAQFRNQDMNQPWTGEFYDGETGRWKTAERDYNHSTWLDILIPDLIGIVPRADDVLEIDPLLPEGALSSFVLDGVRYHGHDVAVRWESREGLRVLVDGRERARSRGLSRLEVPLAP